LEAQKEFDHRKMPQRRNNRRAFAPNLRGVSVLNCKSRTEFPCRRRRESIAQASRWISLAVAPAAPRLILNLCP
jgi:hypothetical protein